MQSNCYVFHPPYEVHDTYTVALREGRIGGVGQDSARQSGQGRTGQSRTVRRECGGWGCPVGRYRYGLFVLLELTYHRH